MEIHLKSWPYTRKYEGKIEQPCIIEDYKLHYPFLSMSNPNAYKKRVVWNWESRHPIQPLYFDFKTDGIYNTNDGPKGNFYYHIYVSRKIDITNLHFDTKIPDATTTPPPTMLEYMNQDERITWGRTDSPIRKHYGFFAIDPSGYLLNLPLRKVKMGWTQTEPFCAPRIPKLGNGDVQSTTKQFINFEKKVLATCSQDDEVKNDIIITPRIKEIPSFMFCSSLEEAREKLNITFLYPSPHWINHENEIKFIFDLKYEH